MLDEYSDMESYRSVAVSEADEYPPDAPEAPDLHTLLGHYLALRQEVVETGGRAEGDRDRRAGRRGVPPRHRATSAMTATWGRRPVAEAAALAACEHITVLGMDEPGKRELPEETLAGATRYADDPALVLSLIHI